MKDLDTETDSTVLQHHSKRLNNIVLSCPIFILFLMTFVWIHTFTRCTFFRPLTKLQEGNVFTNVCLSIGGICLVLGPFWGMGGYDWSQVPSGWWLCQVHPQKVQSLKGTSPLLEGTLPRRYIPPKVYPQRIHPRRYTPEGTPHYWHLVVATRAGGTYPTECFLFSPVFSRKSLYLPGVAQAFGLYAIFNFICGRVMLICSI